MKSYNCVSILGFEAGNAITTSGTSPTQQTINIVDTELESRVRGKVIAQTELVGRLAQFGQARE